MARQGRSTERVVEALESVLVAGAAEITSPGRLFDEKAGELREFDVVLTVKIGHHEFVTCIEVRARSRRLGTPAVEAFITKTADVHASKKVIVSTSGFTKPALRKAKAHGIRCLSLESVENDPHCLVHDLVNIKPTLNGWVVTVQLVDSEEYAAALGVTRDELKRMPFRLVDSNDGDVPAERVARQAWGDLRRTPQFMMVSGSRKHRVLLPVDNADPVFVLFDGRTERFSASGFEVVLDYTVTHEILPVEALKYGDAQAATPLVTAAVSAPMKVAGREVRLVFSPSEDGTHQVTIVNAPEDSS